MKNRFCHDGITSGTLKIIAIITMLIDHFAYAIYRILPGYHLQAYNMMRHIGRISFPVFAFLIVEGFMHTGNVKRYISRLFLFALLSEVTYDIAFHDTVFFAQKQNVFFTLVLGLCAISGISRCMIPGILNYIKQAGIIVLASVVAELIQSDYGMHGVLLIIVLFYARFYVSRWLPLIGVLSAFFLLEQPYAAIAFLPVYFYNGKRGPGGKYVFYFVYPVHLLMLGFIRFLCLNYYTMP